jgi:hypothetical protein
MSEQTFYLATVGLEGGSVTYFIDATNKQLAERLLAKLYKENDWDLPLPVKYTCVSLTTTKRAPVIEIGRQ